MERDALVVRMSCDCVWSNMRLDGAYAIPPDMVHNLCSPARSQRAFTSAVHHFCSPIHKISAGFTNLCSPFTKGVHQRRSPLWFTNLQDFRIKLQQGGDNNINNFEVSSDAAHTVAVCVAPWPAGLLGPWDCASGRVGAARSSACIERALTGPCFRTQLTTTAAPQQYLGQYAFL